LIAQDVPAKTFSLGKPSGFGMLPGNAQRLFQRNREHPCKTRYPKTIRTLI
jgi:hypothetical protein